MQIGLSGPSFITRNFIVLCHAGLTLVLESVMSTSCLCLVVKYLSVEIISKIYVSRC